MIENKNTNKDTPDLYIKVKDKTVIFYTKTQQLTDDQIEQMMIESVPYDYQETYS